MLVLILATCGDNQNDNTDVKKWIVGAVTLHGFENKDMFYGTSGSLYAICPVFRVFSPSGMYPRKNFLYWPARLSSFSFFNGFDLEERIKFIGNILT